MAEMEEEELPVPNAVRLLLAVAPGETLASLLAETLAVTVTDAAGETEEVGLPATEGLAATLHVTLDDELGCTLAVREGKVLSLGSMLAVAVPEAVLLSVLLPKGLCEMDPVSEKLGAPLGVTEREVLSESVALGDTLSESVTLCATLAVRVALGETLAHTEPVSVGLGASEGVALGDCGSTEVPAGHSSGSGHGMGFTVPLGQ